MYVCMRCFSQMPNADGFDGEATEEGAQQSQQPLLDGGGADPSAEISALLPPLQHLWRADLDGDEANEFWEAVDTNSGRGGFRRVDPLTQKALPQEASVVNSRL